MPTEILALIDKPWLLLLVLAVGAGMGIAVERFVNRIERDKRRAYWRGRNHEKGARDRNRRLLDAIVSGGTKPVDATEFASQQLKTVMRASFRSRPLLNKPERRLLDVLDAALAEQSREFRVMGQVSLGEILASPDKDAFLAINAKRVDLLIVDADCTPVMAIEFQGTGHYLGEDAAARDAVKKEALRRAGIGYAEIKTGDTPADVRNLIGRLARQKSALSA